LDSILQTLLVITLIVFMVGSLLEVGLTLRLSDVGTAMGHVRFLALSLLCAFVLGPALAFLLTRIIPLAEPYAIGLLFLGMTPCAPFLPILARRAGGDLAYVAAFMLLASAGTVVCMPLMTPVLVKGFTASAWTIAQPLVLYIATPLAVGAIIRIFAEPFAEKAHPIVKRVTGIDTVIMLGLILWIYQTEFISAIGTYAIGTQLLFYLLVTAAAYGLGSGLRHSQKSVLALGVCTRNIGAAFAPLISAAGTDQRAIAMVAVAVPISVLCGFGAAYLLARRAPKAEPAAT
jgi:bile acid:Na+ symporter, BASS family